MMKKIAFLLAAVFLLAGCSQKEESTASKDKAPSSAKSAAQQTEPKDELDTTPEKKVMDAEDETSSKASQEMSAEKQADEKAKSAEQIARENSLESNDTEADIKTPEEFLRLPIWEIERQAMDRLKAASESKTVKKMQQELQQARSLFASLETNLTKLNINNNEDVQLLYDTQNKVVTEYKQRIDTYLKTSNPDALKSLQEADQAFIDFIKKAKQVVADNE